MKTPKGYRFSPMTLWMIQQIKEENPKMTETEIVESAIWMLHDKMKEQLEWKKAQRTPLPWEEKGERQ